MSLPLTNNLFPNVEPQFKKHPLLTSFFSFLYFYSIIFPSNWSPDLKIAIPTRRLSIIPDRLFFAISSLPLPFPFLMERANNHWHFLVFFPSHFSVIFSFFLKKLTLYSF
ncbi:unnamed protein product [Meloidogyne enterolobii]|uniref:Uncharacterized protein n=1 Tax=Meloidogyne enterolobii TaxID=390850 RepID=A0ACB1A045_MELEN